MSSDFKKKIKKQEFHLAFFTLFNFLTTSRAATFLQLLGVNGDAEYDIFI